MKGKSLNIILLGRKTWAAKALGFLLEQGHNVVAVVGKEAFLELDHRKGSLLEEAKERGIQTAAINELYSWIEAGAGSPVPFEKVDLVISYLFWEKIKEPLLSIPKLGAINFHPAPLPDLRGVGGYNKAILEEREYYGVTAHYMSGEIDEGDIIKVHRLKIDPQNETALSLEQKSQEEMFLLFKEVITSLQKNVSLPRMKQNKQEGIYINREQFEQMKYIMPHDNEEVIRRKIRAFWFPPYDGAKIKIAGTEFTLVDKSILNDLSKWLH
ncbi:formyltransferase family protein [Bacillus songklensis]|uniref:Formyltransferase family protein n=1 Tax=Bacillus songklensis TaxID=1069116 RepID=A0ABV8AZY4_9BACI